MDTEWILFSEKHPKMGQWITLIWDDNTECDAVWSGVNWELSPLPIKWKPFQCGKNEFEVEI